MRMQAITEQQRARQEELALKNKRAGLAIFQASWIMVFFCLALVNLQLRSSYTAWPPPGVEKLSVFLPTIATIGLLASAVFARNGLKAVEADNITGFIAQWRWAIGLGLAFFIVMIYEFFAVSPAALETQYGMIFRVMTAFHALHAIVIALIMIQLYRQSGTGAYHAGNSWAIEGTAKLWYFVVVAWIIFYIVLYWV